MTDDLTLTELECLAWVAEGRAALMPDASAARLIRAGLIRKPERVLEDGAVFELTPAGLARVRSSDQ